MPQQVAVENSWLCLPCRWRRIHWRCGPTLILRCYFKDVAVCSSQLKFFLLTFDAATGDVDRFSLDPIGICSLQPHCNACYNCMWSGHHVAQSPCLRQQYHDGDSQEAFQAVFLGCDLSCSLSNCDVLQHGRMLFILSGDFGSVMSKHKPPSSFRVRDFSDVCQDESSLSKPSSMEYLYSE